MEASDTGDARQQAIKRIKAKRSWAQTGVTFLIINVLLIGIWAVTGAGFFWPVFPLLGMGIAFAFQTYGTFYGNRPISEQEIEEEIRRGGNGPAV
jgi:fatty acid desaturase